MKKDQPSISQNNSLSENQLEGNSRFLGVLNAIEFFSQRFDIEQLISYAYDFTFDLLSPDKIALWHIENDIYTMKYSSGYVQTYNFKYNTHYDEIVYFHAGLLYSKHILNMLPEEIYQVFNPDFCIPLIMDKNLFGLIGVKRNSIHPFDHNDELIACALMNLFSTALANYIGYERLVTTKKQLDEKIFNLFAINQSSKALLGELSLTSLYDMAINVFSELTQSSFTTFFIKDHISENYLLMSYKNVKSNKLNLDITLYENKNTNSPLPIVIDMENNQLKNLFINHFHNGDDIIKKINPRYIVLLQKSSQLVGFVTLGIKVNDTEYESSIFELVESLASSTYIAINNAIHIEKINLQKNIIKNKLDELIKLGNLMKNINSAQTFDNAISLVMNTLNISFGIDMGFFALYNARENNFKIVNRINISNNVQQLEMTQDFLPLLEGEVIMIFEESILYDVFPDFINDFAYPPMGCVMIPVFIKSIDLDLIGYFAILKSRYKTLVTEEQLVSYEAIATHIAPVIHQLQYAETIKQLYQPDYNQVFLTQLSLEIEESDDFNLDLYVILISRKNSVCFDPFDCMSQLNKYFKKIYPIDKKNIFILTNKSSELSVIDELELTTYDTTIYQFNKDFDSINSFKSIFSVKG